MAAATDFIVTPHGSIVQFQATTPSSGWKITCRSRPNAAHPSFKNRETWNKVFNDWMKMADDHINEFIVSQGFEENLKTLSYDKNSGFSYEEIEVI